MKLLPKIPLGEETENGFRVIDDPARDFSFMDARRKRSAARCAMIWFWLAITAFAGALVWNLAK